MVTKARGAAEGGTLGPKGDLKDVLAKHLPMSKNSAVHQANGSDLSFNFNE
jgi:hypothetical protein